MPPTATRLPQYFKFLQIPPFVLYLICQSLKGQQYQRAADAFTKALDLAPSVPSATSKILALYNNRSAMYEKLGEFDKSLSDISIVLAMDGKHIKAHNRRARVLEAKVS
jgi:tetratricopeptide (TPR) repeat protein